MQAFVPSSDPAESQVRRQTMVDCQIRTFGVTDQRLIARFLAVPRERFLPDDISGLAYSDIGFTLEAASTSGEPRYLLPPLILARLVQGGRVRSTDRVLDVACGTGYSTAILAGLAGEIVALESDADRRGDVETRLSGLGQAGLGQVGLGHVRALDGDLADGAHAEGPFDVILVNGAIEMIPDALLAQLAEGGRLLTIRRDADDPTGRAAKAVCFEKRGGEIGLRPLFDASAPVLRAFRRAAAFVF